MIIRLIVRRGRTRFTPAPFQRVSARTLVTSIKRTKPLKKPTHLVRKSTFTEQCRRRVPIIIDTDIGQDIDDTWAIAFVLSRPDVFDVQLITTTNLNAPGRANLLAGFLTSMGRDDVPIGIGVSQYVVPPPYQDPKFLAYPEFGPYVGYEYPWVIENYGSGETAFEMYRGPKFKNGVEAMANLLKNSDPGHPTYLLGLAPFMTIADAAKQLTPAEAGAIRVFLQSGSVYGGFYGLPPRILDFNTGTNVAAAQTLYQTPWKSVTLATTETSSSFQILGEEYQRVLRSPFPIPQAVIANYSTWYEENMKNSEHTSISIKKESPTTTPTNGSSIMYDVMAAACAFTAANSPNPATFDDYTSIGLQGTTYSMLVNDIGITELNPYGSPVTACANWVGNDMMSGVNAITKTVVDSLVIGI